MMTPYFALMYVKAPISVFISQFQVCPVLNKPVVSGEFAFLNFRELPVAETFFHVYPINFSAVACPGWLIPSRLKIFQTVMAMIRMSSQSDR